MPTLETIYRTLLDAYGPQGWWPLIGHQGANPTKTGAVHGYHPGDYSFPRNEEERFEICLGAILTQNTAWPNVEKALLNLREHGPFAPELILRMPEATLLTAIRPSGYYNAKARKLREFSRFYTCLAGRTPTREELLGVWGIGPETADSMRLYAFEETELVVDAYTRRILAHLRLVSEAVTYEALKVFCADSLPTDPVVYQEFHALMVEHAKRHYRRKPYKDLLISKACEKG